MGKDHAVTNDNATDNAVPLTPSRRRALVQADAEDGRLFEWHDGPLVLAMREGGVFLMDEISLADDSVLERLNRYTP